MLSEAAALFDPGALTVVVAGTLIATAARAGRRDLRAAGRALVQIVTPSFNAARNRQALARAATAIRERGALCAETEAPPDPAFARLVEAVCLTGTTHSLQALSRSHRTSREIARLEAQRVFEYAGELAPVFGLVGTLFAITQLAPIAADTAAETTMAAVATAVLSSLYGVLSAHLVYLPLARAIERRGEREEEAREKLVDWFESELAGEHDHRPASRRSAKRDAA